MALSSSTFSDLGSGISSIFGGVGDLAEAAAYKKAAGYATENAAISLEAAQIQQTQAARQVSQVIGGQKAAYGGAGLKESGTALDLLRSSQQQGNLQMQLLHTQGLINSNAYQEQAAANTGMANQAKAAAGGGFLGGLLSIGAGILGIFSDADLKENIVEVARRADGIGIYEYNFKGFTKRWRGVLAQEVLTARPDAVSVGEGGVMSVDYLALGMQMEAA